MLTLSQSLSEQRSLMAVAPVRLPRSSDDRCFEKTPRFSPADNTRSEDAWRRNGKTLKGENIYLFKGANLLENS